MLMDIANCWIQAAASLAANQLPQLQGLHLHQMNGRKTGAFLTKRRATSAYSSTPSNNNNNKNKNERRRPGKVLKTISKLKLKPGQQPLVFCLKTIDPIVLLSRLCVSLDRLLLLLLLAKLNL